MKIKICGLAQPENAQQIANLQPDFIGCIFTKVSKRYINPVDASQIIHPNKIGVFVNQTVQEILSICNTVELYAIQLHGEESPELCEEIKKKQPKIKIIKAFSIQNQTDFKTLQSYKDKVDYFLFDTKGKLPGGNGYTFNWELLNKITIPKPYFLSGGIDIQNLNDLKNLTQKPFALDVNSKLENAVGVKNVELTKKIINHVKQI